MRKTYNRIYFLLRRERGPVETLEIMHEAKLGDEHALDKIRAAFRARQPFPVSEAAE